MALQKSPSCPKGPKITNGHFTHQHFHSVGSVSEKVNAPKSPIPSPNQRTAVRRAALWNFSQTPTSRTVVDSLFCCSFLENVPNYQNETVSQHVFFPQKTPIGLRRAALLRALIIWINILFKICLMCSTRNILTSALGAPRNMYIYF